MRKRRVAVRVLAFTMGLVMLAGCGKTAGNGTTDTAGSSVSGSTAENSGADGGQSSSGYQTTYGSKQFDNVTITVELFDRSNAPEGTTITNNKWVEYVNQEMNKVGIQVEFVTVPRSDEIAKMQAMMASGTAPDLTITYTIPYAQDYFRQGGIWDLSEFIDGEGQAENIKNYIGSDVLAVGREPEGELIGIVARRATTAAWNQFFRKDWLDALGLEMPETVDELYHAVEQMVVNNPDQKQNAVGAGYTPPVYDVRTNLFLAFSELAGDPKERDIAFGYDYYYDPGSREYFRFLNKMYNNGLIDKEYYVLSADDFKSDIVNGLTGYFEYNVNYSVDILRGSIMKTLQENEPQAELVSIPALKNVHDGKQYSSTYPANGLIAFCPLTASAEKVEACMTYLDWLCTKEGGFALYHGFEGEHFDYDENNVPIVKDAGYNATDKDWLRTDIFLVGNQGYFSTVDDFNACTAKEAPEYEQYVIDNYENALSGELVAATTYTSPTAKELNTDISIVFSDYSVQCVTCPEADFDAVYDEFIKELKDLGVDTIIAERTEYYNEVYNN